MLADRRTRKIVWTDEMALGIEEIDADHASLLKIVQDIDAVLASPRHQGDLHSRIVHLFRFADQHFSHEDTWMDRLPADKYADHIEAHRRMHNAFLSRLAGISNRTASPDGFQEPTGSFEIMLTDMVLEMVSTDRQMVECLRAENLI